MEGMFSLSTAFNQDISSWDVRRVTDMQTMFFGAALFRRNLCPWGSRMKLNEPATRLMFLGALACPRSGSPDYSRDPVSPICFECGSAAYLAGGSGNEGRFLREKHMFEHNVTELTKG